MNYVWLKLFGRDGRGAVVQATVSSKNINGYFVSVVYKIRTNASRPTGKGTYDNSAEADGS
jgi:hypothetical protein